MIFLAMLLLAIATATAITITDVINPDDPVNQGDQISFDAYWNYAPLEQPETLYLSVCGTIAFDNTTATCDETLCSAIFPQPDINFYGCGFNTTSYPPAIYNSYVYVCYYEPSTKNMTVTEQHGFEFTSSSYYSSGNDIIETSDGGYAVAGIEQFQTFPTQPANLIVWKLNSTYGIEWTYNPLVAESSGKSILESKDGNIVVGGMSQSGGKNYMVVYKLNISSGTLLNGGSYQYTGQDTYLYDIAELYDGSIIAVGDANIPASPRTAQIIRYDENITFIGNTSFYFDSTDGTTIFSIIPDDNGQNMTITGMDSVTAIDTKIFISKRYGNGTEIWTESYNITSQSDTGIELINGSYYITGNSGGGSSDIILLKRIDGSVYYNTYGYGDTNETTTSLTRNGNDIVIASNYYNISSGGTGTYFVITDPTLEQLGEHKIASITTNRIKTASDGKTLITGQDSGNDMLIAKISISLETNNTDLTCSASEQEQWTIVNGTSNPLCGDGIIDASIGEQCEFIGGSQDWGNIRGCQSFGEDNCDDEGNLTCDPDTCKFDLTECQCLNSGTGYCGDETIQTPNSVSEYEQCDTTNFGTLSCASFDNFNGGNISCDVNCEIDTTGCLTMAECEANPPSCCVCGDGICNGGSPCFEGFDCEEDCGTPEDVHCVGRGICIDSQLIDHNKLGDPDGMTRGMLPTGYYGMIAFFDSTYGSILALVAVIVLASIILLLGKFIFKMMRIN
jgi:hypothetical protein